MACKQADVPYKKEEEEEEEERKIMKAMMMMTLIIIIIIIIIIIGATGTISKSFRKYVSNIPGNHDVRELQKTAILGTAHILRKVLM
jgi:flagellar basal body-associated protein FliL